MIGSSNAPAAAVRAVPMIGAAAAYTSIGISAEIAPMAKTHPTEATDVGKTWFHSRANRSGLITTAAPTATDASLSKGSRSPSRSMSTETLNPNDSGEANRSSESPEVPRPRPTVAARTTRKAEAAALNVGRRAKRNHPDTRANKG